MCDQESATSSTSNATFTESRPDVSIPPSVIVLGMAGSGKTSFVQRLTAHLHANKTPPYVINLDPACNKVPFPANVDIRDTVNYKQVMTSYGLGPNGAIITCLNLMCTRFDQVLDLIRRRSNAYSMCLLDTPGQIEAFTWSASGSIITDTLASSHPTVVIYVIDSARATNPTTFMSNMLYACSILYRTKLPFIVVFNKADIVRPTFAQKWMTDFEKFDEALEESRSSYMNNFSRSLSLVLDEFYTNLKTVCVSSATGEGMQEVVELIGKCVEEYKTEYVPMYEKVLEEKKKLDEEIKKQKMEEVLKEKEVLSASVVEKDADGAVATTARLERIHLGGVEAENEEDANRMK
ncbi:hypothetical protein WR25_16670 [Diploscapter pachys]|uniref:GPN-loop GTPase n=1 Tax=Diploscapter pachys TaxID=2018661 RepID=A0A2A2LUD1_9BILA|nr:hypothetical protein WR25_16670 [Diploscapter pachys]